jgi:long-chain fatty acid transport protein
VRQLRHIILTTIVLFTLSGSAFASAWNTFGVTGRDVGMAGAYSAPVDDFSAVHYNPAGLARIDTFNVGVSYFYEKPEILITEPDGTKLLARKRPHSHIPLDGAHGPIVGATIPLDRLLKRPLPLPITFGLAAFVPSNKARIMNDSFRHPVIYSPGRISKITINFGFGTEITDWLKVGLSFSNNIYVLERLNVQIFIESREDQAFFLRRSTISNHDTSVHFAPILGLLIEPIDNLSIAAVYRDATFIRNSTEAMTDQVYLFGLGLIEKPVSIKSKNLTGFTPRNISLAASYILPADILLSLEAIAWKWSDFKTYATAESPPGKFKDTLALRLGLEYRATPSIALRCGGQYERSPVPDEPDGFNYIDGNRTVVALGAGYRILEGLGLLVNPVDIDLGLQYHSMAESKYDDGTINGTFTSEGNVYSSVLSARFDF